MHILIAILLAIAGPLLLDEAFRNNRVWAAFIGTLWLVSSLFLVGLNFGTAWDFFLRIPFTAPGLSLSGRRHSSSRAQEARYGSLSEGCDQYER